MVKTHRLSLDINEDTRDMLGALRLKIGAVSMAEVVRKALALIDVVADAVVHHGAVIIIRREDGTEKEVAVLL